MEVNHYRNNFSLKELKILEFEPEHGASRRPDGEEFPAGHRIKERPDR
jgi:hypothetical protein